MNMFTSLLHCIRTLGLPALVDAGKKAFASRATSKSGVGVPLVQTEDVGEECTEGLYDSVLGLYGSLGLLTLLVYLCKYSAVNFSGCRSPVGARLLSSSPLTVRMLKHPASAPGAPRRLPSGSGPLSFFFNLVSIFDGLPLPRWPRQ